MVLKLGKKDKQFKFGKKHFRGLTMKKAGNTTWKRNRHKHLLNAPY